MVGLSLINKRCGQCKTEQPVVNFNKDKKTKDGLYYICKECGAAYAGAYRAEHRESITAKSAAYREENRESITAKNTAYKTEHPEWIRFITKKSRAKQAGIDFDLIFEDVIFPSHCPALGTLLDYTFGNGKCPPNSPSFDRIDPRKGYVTGNVIVISSRANTIKNNASVDELLRVASFYQQLIPEVEHSHEVA
jgi:hypothetical protein